MFEDQLILHGLFPTLIYDCLCFHLVTPQTLHYRRHPVQGHLNAENNPHCQLLVPYKLQRSHLILQDTQTHLEIISHVSIGSDLSPIQQKPLHPSHLIFTLHQAGEGRAFPLERRRGDSPEGRQEKGGKACSLTPAFQSPLPPGSIWVLFQLQDRCTFT